MALIACIPLAVSFVFFCFTGLLASTTTPDSIFILAGQSNMVGRGGVYGPNGTKWDGIVPSECELSPAILRFNELFSWEPAREPLHRGIDPKTAGIGPGMPFANTVLERDYTFGVIGLIPCAIGGTKISQWAQGTQNYNRIMARVSVALQGGAKLQGLLWYQGESDTGKIEDAKQYQSNLEKFFNDLRGDLGIPTLPIIQVALATGGDFIEVVRQGQLDVGLPNVRTVDAKGLEIKAYDRDHLFSYGQVHLGQILGYEYILDSH